MTLTEFLLARIAEDAVACWHDSGCNLMAGHSDFYDGKGCDCEVPARVLAECEAKRRIVEAHSAQHDEWLFCLLTLPYADHPDYREEWKP